MSDLTPCVVADDVFCRSYLPGHHTHWIHAKHIGRTPWGWRDAVVTGFDAGWTTVAYVDSGRPLRTYVTVVQPPSRPSTTASRQPHGVRPMCLAWIQWVW